MAVYDEAAERIVVHIVYDGPALAGKTTNLEQLCSFFTEHRRGRLYSTGNTNRRTLYLDWLQLEGGVIQGQKLRCQLITVPGQAVLARRRWYLLKRADVVVFVLDSTPSGVEAARAMFDFMRRFAIEQDPPRPVVVQANKQDQRGALDRAQIARSLMLDPTLVVPASAHTGTGVRETTVLAIRAAASMVQKHILGHGLASLSGRACDGEQLKSQIEAAEQDDPQSPVEVVLAHRRALEPKPAMAPRNQRPPPLPQSAVPHGLIWPAATGRELLRRVPLEDAEWRHDLTGQIGTKDGSGRADTIIVEAGFWCLKTSPRRAYPDCDSARAALAALARSKARLGSLLAKNTVLTLEPDAQGTYWMWTVSPWLTTLRAAMIYAEKHRYLESLGESLLYFAEAALESLKLALECEIQLDVHPSNFARLGARVFYLDDDIGHGARVPSIGHALLRRVEEYAAHPAIVDAYVAYVVQRLRRDFSRTDVARLGLRDAFESAIVSSVIGQTARSRLLEAAA